MPYVVGLWIAGYLFSAALLIVSFIDIPMRPRDAALAFLRMTVSWPYDLFGAAFLP